MEKKDSDELQQFVISWVAGKEPTIPDKEPIEVKSKETSPKKFVDVEELSFSRYSFNSSFSVSFFKTILSSSKLFSLLIFFFSFFLFI